MRCLNSSKGQGRPPYGARTHRAMIGGTSNYFIVYFIVYMMRIDGHQCFDNMIEETLFTSIVYIMMIDSHQCFDDMIEETLFTSFVYLMMIDNHQCFDDMIEDTLFTSLFTSLFTCDN